MTAIHLKQCNLMQVCSAIHNQEYTLIDDYVTGLKTMLYLQVCSSYIDHSYSTCIIISFLM